MKGEIFCASPEKSSFRPPCLVLFFLFTLGGKAFTSKEFLKTHSNRKHNDQRIKSRDDGIFECKICNRELKRYGHAERHMKLLHPSEESTCLNFEDSQVCVLITM